MHITNGIVNDAGGGVVTVYVDRDLATYPSPGAACVVLTDDPPPVYATAEHPGPFQASDAPPPLFPMVCHAPGDRGDRAACGATPPANGEGLLTVSVPAMVTCEACRSGAQFIPPPGDRADQMYRWLHGAREALCLAQHQLAVVSWRAMLGKAVAHIDYVGSRECGEQWSRFDRADTLADTEPVQAETTEAVWSLRRIYDELAWRSTDYATTKALEMLAWHVQHAEQETVAADPGPQPGPTNGRPPTVAPPSGPADAIATLLTVLAGLTRESVSIWHTPDATADHVFRVWSGTPHGSGGSELGHGASLVEAITYAFDQVSGAIADGRRP